MSKNKKQASREGLTIQFIPYSEISGLNSTERIKKLLQIILKNKVIVIQGRLRAEEETRLIEDTMVMVGTVKGFKGIELAVISPNPNEMGFMTKVKHGIASALVGDTESLTIIGPAAIIKDMKRDPSKLEVMMNRN
ncbi:DUF2073 domain-containing protein [Candidatus Pacearchaeota archaeon]|nr:DUF2073 domain-containing protein [Candidatus Pacearchaeota archaeon]